MHVSFLSEAWLLSVAMMVGPIVVANEATAKAERLLEKLVGDWSMVGQVTGEPVTYRLTARRTLNSRFVELHMIDVKEPPGYEARVFLGHDPATGRLIVHWLDAFGAGSSIPHGVGTAQGDVLTFEMAYAEGPFRDTFTFRPADASWHFRLESGDAKGNWKLFAEYEVRRAP